MEEIFNTGDKVQLKSGGPVMTITNTKTGAFNTYLCSWIDKDDKPHDAMYPKESLIKIVE